MQKQYEESKVNSNRNPFILKQRKETNEIIDKNNY